MPPISLGMAQLYTPVARRFPNFRGHLFGFFRGEFEETRLQLLTGGTDRGRTVTPRCQCHGNLLSHGKAMSTIRIHIGGRQGTRKVKVPNWVAHSDLDLGLVLADMKSWKEDPVNVLPRS